MKPKIIFSLILICVLSSLKAQIVSTFAGSGAAGSSDGTGTAATFYYPQKICLDPVSGNFYVADYNSRKIRMITPEGVVTTLAGSGAIGSADGTGSAASFRAPSGICTDASGNVFVVDPGNDNIRKITPAGVVTTFAGQAGSHGTANGIGTAARFYCPEDICMDPTTGNFYVADGCNNRIRMITPAGVVSTFVGSTVGSADGAATVAKFSYPCAISCDPSGNFSVCDLSNNKIRLITPAGVVSTLAGSGSAGSVDATGTGASFNYPYDICTDLSGNFYVADGYNRKVRKITPAGVVTTYAGTGAGGSTDGPSTTVATFNMPSGVCANTAGDIFVSDLSNMKIRRICPCTVNSPLYDTIITSGISTSALFNGATNIVFKNIYVSGTLTVDNNVTLSGCNLVMAPSAAISLTTGDLTLNSQTHIYGCTNMWNGINVPSGRALNVSGSVFIEDALKAITISQGATVTIDQAIFNRNLTAIELTANTTATSPLTISNTFITSRNIPFSVIPVLDPTYSSLVANITSTSPYAPPSVLRPPYNDRKGCYGINATDVALVNIGIDAVNKTNYFDAIMSGINLTRSNAIIYNNRFQYLLGYGGAVSCMVGSPCYFASGNGITASGNPTGNYAITIGGASSYQPNSFYNTYSAISVSDYQTNIITNNSIDNSNTGPFSLFVTNYGNMGIYLRPAANQMVNITNNSLIRNCATAISVNRTTASCMSTQGITINNNTISANAPGYCATGINMQDAYGSAPPVGYGIQINSNNITEAQNGITTSYVKSGFNLSNNIVGIAYDPTALRYGIRVTNCQYLKVIGNSNIHCTTSSIYTNATANIRGIYLLNSANSKVTCNQIDNVTQSLMFEGNCTSSLVAYNVFNSAYYGLYMKNNAEIGTQGDALYPSNNVYNGPFSSTYQTFTDNVSNVNTNSIFYCSTTSGLPTVPTHHGGVNPYVNGTGIRSTSSSFTTDCSWLSKPINGGNNSTPGSSLNNAEPVIIGDINIVATLYPNPNNGKMMLAYSLQENEKGILTIKDLTGILIKTYEFYSSSNQLSISEDELASGTYFYEIIINDKSIKKDKLIIIK